MRAPIDLLARPVYGMAQVDWILRLTPGTARRWIDGYARGGKRYEPVVRPETTGDEIVTWGEFTEARLLSEFRDGVPMVRMRPAVARLRELFGHRYPLAHASPWLETSGKELVLRVQEEVGLISHFQLVVLRNDQLVLTLPTDRFVRSVEWDEGVVRRLHPLPELDRVVLDPLRQFGEPVVRSVPTAVIAEQVRAGDRIGMIAQLYELSVEEVEQAIRYELLRGRDTHQAA
jgi:uncharacterized protein (DUF433 family)